MDTEQSDVYEKLIAASIRFVSYRPRSEKEIRDFLEKKLKRSHTTAPLVTTHVVGRLTDLGYIDDYAFGTWWVDQRTGRKPKGERVIRMELMRKGIAPAVIDEVIGSGMKGERSEAALAKAAIEKKRQSWKNLPVLTQKRKLADYLMRRGFSSDVVWGLIDDVLSKE